MSNISPLKDFIHQLVHATLQKFNLVTREEFEIQSRVLQKTRQRLEQMERKLMELDGNL